MFTATFLAASAPVKLTNSLHVIWVTGPAMEAAPEPHASMSGSTIASSVTGTWVRSRMRSRGSARVSAESASNLSSGQSNMSLQ